MTKSEARRYVCRCAAVLLDPAGGHLNEFLEEGCTEDEYALRVRALKELVHELYRRGGKPL